MPDAINTTVIYFIISQLVVLGGVIASACMVRSQLGGIRKDHEARRREKAVEILFKFAELSDNGLLFLPKKLIESLNSSEKKLIIECQGDVSLSKESLFYIKNIVCREHKLCDEKCDSCQSIKEEAGRITIKQEDVMLIRQAIVTYLNIIEFIAMAAVKNVADNKIIAEQFEYLLNSKDKYLSMLGDCNLKDNFPCIQEFLKINIKETVHPQPEKL